MRIQVTAEDIANGIPYECEACPVALALKKHSPNVDADIIVDADNIWWGEAAYSTPEEVVSFITNFDKGDAVEPFEFYLEEALEEDGE